MVTRVALREGVEQLGWTVDHQQVAPPQLGEERLPVSVLVFTRLSARSALVSTV